ncbi:hypothetical protein F2P81_018683 [Scophthalmus maximus]|uniref:Ataxin-10 n=1 Tax=Scophthalmus maximus TaxID=52904 RepID=A0A6A4SBB1_SCOMX|nr:hypothetical protein F2P81_018683 [Scophthalmus maximus]
MKQANMAALTNSNQDLSASIAGVCNEKHRPEHLQALKTFTAALRDREHRDAVEEQAFTRLLQVLTRLSGELQAAEEEGGDGGEELRPTARQLQLQLIAECFRAQRNACVQSTRNQSLLRELGFVDVSLKLLSFLLTANVESRDGIFEALRCGIQFLGNLAVGNQKCKDVIWQLSFPNLLLLTLLELLFAQLREEDSEECGVPPSVARFLANFFQKGCGAVLTLATGSASSDEVLQEALTVISLLDVLCEMTSDHKQFMFLQDHPDLLVTTVELLGQVHSIGKASKNIFSAAQNFSSLSGDGDSSSYSPVISFKAHLIRLIGNLCHSNTNNQEKVRELDGLPLILDNCNIDSNNPFISQWAIFAIRNILENNTQNQELVADLERQGPADYSALRELGFLVEERDGGVLLKTVRKDS